MANATSKHSKKDKTPMKVPSTFTSLTEKIRQLPKNLKL